MGACAHNLNVCETLRYKRIKFLTKELFKNESTKIKCETVKLNYEELYYVRHCRRQLVLLFF